ncbi:DUF2510 domain-containing protein [Paenarthrobacter sp. NPDC018779]|uniref:DUF2510 domain-containing protein n=1 Tax=Paenarthrobacter sp. NPDC018779 TaxID=3364375 RepID=UPI0037CB68A2
MTNTPAPDHLPQPSTTAAPGWYADPADPRYNRWWDGSAWTAHVGPPASQLLAQRPLIGPDAPVYNVFIWLMAVLPLLPAIALLTWNPDLRFYTTSRGGLAPDPASIFTVGYFLAAGSLVLVYVVSVVLAFFDHRRLLRAGVVRPFHWAWAFIYMGGVVYVIGRAIIVNKVARGRGWWPLGVLAAGWLLYIVGGYVKGILWMQSIVSGIGYGS